MNASKFLTIIFIVVGLSPIHSQNLDSGLIGFYPFNGNALDSSSLNNDGVVNGAQLAADRKGAASSAYYFGGTDVITISNYNNMSPADEVSVSAWIKTNSAPGPSYTAIYDRLEANDGFALVLKPSGIVRFSVNGGLGIASSTAIVTDNQWHYVVGTYNRNTGKIRTYVDCQLDGESNYSAQITYFPEPRNSIGGPGGLNQSYFVGNIDEVRVYNRELSGTEIQLLCSIDSNSISIPEVESKNLSFSVYPNPSSTDFTVSLTNYSEPYSLALISANGAVVFRQEDVASEELTIKGSNLAPGVYTLLLFSGKEFISQKILRQ